MRLGTVQFVQGFHTYSNVIKIVLMAGFILPSLLGCSLPYIVRSGYDQMLLLNQRKPIEKVLQEENLSEEYRRKLILAESARDFAETDLALTPTNNYRTFVDLKRPYVSWVAVAAPRYRLEPYLWKFPIIGSLPYKGFFKEESAHKEAKKFDSSKYDTWVRGVSAYSTLGWFNDPILSSMLRNKDHALVNLIIHESVHATVFIKSHADFNERLATYLGNYGTHLFYLKTEGEGSPTIKKIEQEQLDDALFSNFISEEIKILKKWYENQEDPPQESERQAQFLSIQEKFSKKIKPQMKTNSYNYFESIKLNNAVLSSFGTYMTDLSDFEELMKLKDGNIKSFIEFCRGLERAKNPAQKLKDYLSSSKLSSSKKTTESSSSP